MTVEKALGILADYFTILDVEQNAALAYLRERLTQPAIPEADGRGHALDSHIWCENCEKATPLIVDRNNPEIGSSKPTTDFICGECHLVIATTHAIDTRCQPVPERKMPSREELAKAMRAAHGNACQCSRCWDGWLAVADYVLARFGGGGGK
jgi:hypothetical protein